MLGGGGKVGSAWYDLELRDEGFLGQVRAAGGELEGGLAGGGAAVDEIGSKLDAAGNKADETGGRFSRFGDVGKGAVMGIGLAIGNFATGLAMQAPGAAIQLIGNAIELAGNKAESASKAQAIFGESYGIIEERARTAADTVNMSSGAYLANAGTLGNLITNLGFAGDEAATMSADFLQLAADMGSFNNASPEEVVEAIGAAFRGETEPIRRFGVMIDEARLKEEALALGLYDGVGALDAHAKAAATGALIMKQTAVQQGDLAKTAGSLANTQARAAAQQEEAWTKLGAALVPVATIFTNLLSGAITGAVDGLGSIFAIISRHGQPAAVILGILGAMIAGVVLPPTIAWAAAMIAATFPLIALVAAVVGIVAALEHLGILDDIISLFEDLAGIVIGSVQGAFEAIIGIVAELGYRLGGLMGLIMDLGGALIDFADAAIRALNLDFEGAAAAAERGMARVASAGENMARVMGDAGQRAKDQAVATAEEQVRLLEQSTTDGEAQQRAAWASMAKTAGTGAEATTDAVTEGLEPLPDAAGDAAAEAQRQVEEELRKTAEIERQAREIGRYLPDALREGGMDATAIARMTPGDIAAAWRSRRDSWRSAFDQLKTDMSDTMDRAKEIAELKGILAGEGAGKKIRAGLASTDPIVRQQALQTVQLIEDRLDDLAGIGSDAGELVVRQLAAALSRDRAVRIATSNLTNIVKRGMLLESPAQEGPWSERGGPEAWAAMAGDLVTGTLADHLFAGAADVAAGRNAVARAMRPLEAATLSTAFGGWGGVLEGRASLELRHRVELDLRNAPPGITNEAVAAIVGHTLDFDAEWARKMGDAEAASGMRWVGPGG